MAAPQQPDKILILIDVRDPLTKDKEFIRSLQYSPYVYQVDEISERNRRKILVRDENEDEVDNVIANKFVVDINPAKLGEFVLQFVANPTHQRALVYVDYEIEPLPPEGMNAEDLVEEAIKNGQDVEDMLDEFEKGLVQVFELRSGSKLRNIDDDEDDEDQPDEDEDGDDEGDEDDFPIRGSRAVSRSKGPSLLMLDDKDGQDDPHPTAASDDEDEEEAMDELVEEITLSGGAFVIGAPKSIH